VHPSKYPSSRVLSKQSSTYKRHGFVADRVFHLGQRLASEGKASSEKNVEEYAAAPKVRFLMEHALKHFRGHVVPGPCHFELSLGLLASHCCPKIDDLDAVVALLAFCRALSLEIHDVVEFDVAVHDVLLMQIGQRCQQLLSDAHHQRLRKLS